jgi:hypothetical protein
MKPRSVKFATIVVALVLMGLLAPAVHALLINEPFEFENFYSYGGSKNGTWTLTYLGRGGGYCDSNDYRFRINVYQSYPGNDWKMYSNNSRYQRTPTGRIPYGSQLDGANAHICFGAQEFSWVLHPWSYWTVAGVQQNVYTWRR